MQLYIIIRDAVYSFVDDFTQDYLNALLKIKVDIKKNKLFVKNSGYFFEITINYITIF